MALNWRLNFGNDDKDDDEVRVIKTSGPSTVVGVFGFLEKKRKNF